MMPLASTVSISMLYAHAFYHHPLQQHGFRENELRFFYNCALIFAVLLIFLDQEMTSSGHVVGAVVIGFFLCESEQFVNVDLAYLRLYFGHEDNKKIQSDIYMKIIRSKNDIYIYIIRTSKTIYMYIVLNLFIIFTHTHILYIYNIYIYIFRTELVTFCVETAFYNGLLKER